MNPFTQRGRITDPRRFVGRWRELSVVFDRLDAGRPVIITGMPGIGKSSLLTHAAQSAAVNMERPELRAYYIDMAVLPDAEECYNLIMKALGRRGTTAAALEVALIESKAPVLICFDNAERAVSAGWGAPMLEHLARIARRSLIVRPAHKKPPPAPSASDTSTAQQGMAHAEHALLIIAAFGSTAPNLSEPFAVVGLGALSPPEIRLFAEAYLGDTAAPFTPAELRELSTLSVGHPAYLQRAAYHLYITRSKPDYDWRAAYLDEARDRPIPGAPLPPAVFEGDEAASIMAFYGYQAVPGGMPELDRPELGGLTDLLGLFLPLIAALVAWVFTANWLVTGGVLLVSIALVAVVAVLGKRKHSEASESEKEE